MAIIETEIRKLKVEFKKEIAELRKLIVTRLVPDKWVNQDVACALLGVKPRQLCNLRLHLDNEGKKVGRIAWKKSAGKRCQYYKPDIEAYNSQFTIMN